MKVLILSSRARTILKYSCSLTVVIFKSQINERYGLRLPDLEPPTISSNPGCLGFPGCALLALVRPVPPKLAPSLQRSRSVPWPVVLDVQSCTPWCFSGLVILLLFGRCGHRQISTVTRFQANPLGSCTGHEVLALVWPVVPYSLALSS